jgi:hypothetical protein
MMINMETEALYASMCYNFYKDIPNRSIRFNAKNDQISKLTL